MSLEFHFNKMFLKELAKVPEKQRLRIESFVFSEVQKYNTPEAIPNIGKIKGYKNYYKIRFGNYRAGLRLVNNILVFERILHRKDIYNFYP
jgi:mRNA interferase RelE/StbE